MAQSTVAAGLLVDSIYTGPETTYVRVYVSRLGVPAMIDTICTRPAAFALRTDDPNFKELYASVLLALSLAKKIDIYIPDNTDCEDGKFAVATRVSIFR